MTPNLTRNQDLLPALPLAGWKDTLATLHMWTQIVGKVRLKLCPLVNHFWNVAFYLTARGMTTSAMPFQRGTVEVRFDFIGHKLFIETSEGRVVAIALTRQSVAEFYEKFMAALAELGVAVKIWTTPCEIPHPVPFEQDQEHSAYDPESAHKFWRILVWVDQVLKEFRSGFLGKASPVHFFWGSFDLAVTRFSGRRAPERPDTDPITREAYSHEVISAGFWPGNGGFGEAAFYCYAAPAPKGLEAATIQPAKASYNPGLGEFIYLYDDLRREPSPEEALLAFLQSSYEAGATLGEWDRNLLERHS